MPNTFCLNNKIKDNTILITDKLRLFLNQNNIQISDYLILKINKKNIRYQILNIDNNYIYLQEDKININNRNNVSILLDTNIIVSREGNNALDEVNYLFKFFDDRFILCISDFTIKEINNYKVNDQKDIKYKESILSKLNIYQIIQTNKYDNDCTFCSIINPISNNSNNDLIDNQLLFLVWNDIVDILITKDKGIIRKANLLGINKRVYTPSEFIDEFFDYYKKYNITNESLLRIEYTNFADIDYKQPFFDSFRKDYKNFNAWYLTKQKEFAKAYTIKEDNNVKAFLYLKIEKHKDLDSKIKILINDDNILKIASFKSVLTNIKIGERFLYFSFQHALQNKINTIYTTFFDNKNLEIQKYKNLLIEWGFKDSDLFNSNGEKVFIKTFQEYNCNYLPQCNYPIINENCKFWLLPIKYQYHSQLFPDLKTKRENIDLILSTCSYQTYKIKKWYISKYSPPIFNKIQNVNNGDRILIYRMGPDFTYKKYTSSITGECILNQFYIKSIDQINDEQLLNFSIFKNKKELLDNLGNAQEYIIVELLFLQKYNKPIIKFELEQIGINDYRNFVEISNDSYNQISKLSKEKN